MKPKLICAIFAALLMLPVIAGPARAADAGACYAIGDMDTRNLCLAKARKDPSMCYAIQRSDLRSQCLAEVR